MNESQRARRLGLRPWVLLLCNVMGTHTSYSGAIVEESRQQRFPLFLNENKSNNGTFEQSKLSKTNKTIKQQILFTKEQNKKIKVFFSSWCFSRSRKCTPGRLVLLDSWLLDPLSHSRWGWRVERLTRAGDSVSGLQPLHAISATYHPHPLPFATDRERERENFPRYSASPHPLSICVVQPPSVFLLVTCGIYSPRKAPRCRIFRRCMRTLTCGSLQLPPHSRFWLKGDARGCRACACNTAIDP